jgi:hypothetical protein
MIFEFILFAILGWAMFTTWPTPIPPVRWMLAVIYVVLMVIWAVSSFQGWHIGPPPR